jgi:hypothetical protein
LLSATSTTIDAPSFTFKSPPKLRDPGLVSSPGAMDPPLNTTTFELTEPEPDSTPLTVIVFPLIGESELPETAKRRPDDVVVELHCFAHMPSTAANTLSLVIQLVRVSGDTLHTRCNAYSTEVSHTKVPRARSSASNTASHTALISSVAAGRVLFERG